jgi:GNAT superfamily N-acetyltransferase
MLFVTYSSFRARPTLFLEDLFVLPAARSHGLGSALFAALRAQAVRRGCARFEWLVLEWNERAIAFYERAGAKVLPDWRVCRVEL